MKKKFKDMIEEEELKEIIEEVIEEKLNNINNIEVGEEEAAGHPTPHYLSEYGKYLTKVPPTLSILTLQQLKAIQRLIYFASIGLLDKKFVQKFINDYLKLKVSVKKVGREDLKYIVKHGSQKQETTILTRTKTKEDIL
jgi:hypothetical protein